MAEKYDFDLDAMVETKETKTPEDFRQAFHKVKEDKDAVSLLISLGAVGALLLLSVMVFMWGLYGVLGVWLLGLPSLNLLQFWFITITIWLISRF